MSWRKTSAILRSARNILTQVRNLASCGSSVGVGLVLGVYSDSNDSSGSFMELTKTAEKFNSAIENKLVAMLRISGNVPKRGEVRIFYGLVPQFTAIAVVGLGDECVGYNENEQLDENKENIRIASACGCQALQQANVSKISVESFGHAESAAEGASLGVWLYQELKNNQKKIPKLELFDDCDYNSWQIGLEKAASQNLARQLSEMPANMLTPSLFAQCTVDILTKANVNVDVKVRGWIKMMKMEAFLAAAKGSCEPPVFLELNYYGCHESSPPVILVGKGVTFDSGGLCLQDSKVLRDRHGDMGGAACVVATCRAASKLQIPINLKGLIPLYENLPGANALKPGDAVVASNGKSIVVKECDFDGRLSLADALCYAGNFCPRFIADVGTLSKDLPEVFGEATSSVFSNNDSLFDLMRIATIHTGDRVWRLPLWDHFGDNISSDPRVDICDEAEGLGTPCSAAAFLREFVLPRTDWIHIDTFNVNRSDGEFPSYLRKGMSGRPTRTLIEFLAQLGCHFEESSCDESTHRN